MQICKSGKFIRYVDLSFHGVFFSSFHFILLCFIFFFLSIVATMPRHILCTVYIVHYIDLYCISLCSSFSFWLDQRSVPCHKPTQLTQQMEYKHKAREREREEGKKKKKRDRNVNSCAFIHSVYLHIR